VDGSLTDNKEVPDRLQGIPGGQALSPGNSWLVLLITLVALLAGVKLEQVGIDAWIYGIKAIARK
jgi:hypothetical protein